MKSRESGAFALTLVLMVGAAIAFMMTVGGENWVTSLGHEVRDAMYESTGYNPAKIFRRVSLGAEARTQVQILATNQYLQFYFLVGLATAGLSIIFVKRESPLPLRQQQAILVSILIILLLPMALATVTYGEIFAALITKAICIAILMTLGIFAIMELLRVKPRAWPGRAFQLLVLLLVTVEGILLPGLYGWFFFWGRGVSGV